MDRGVPEQNHSQMSSPEGTPVFRGLGLRLLGIVFLALLPAIGLLFYESLGLRRSAVADAKAEVLRLATAAAESQARGIEGTRGLLTALATNLPQIRKDNTQACRRMLISLLRENPSYLTLAVIDSTGKTVCSALPMPDTVWAADRPYFQRARRTGAFAVGDYQIGRVTGKPSINVAQPLRAADGQFTGVVMAAIDLNSFVSLARQLNLPPGTVFQMFDRQGALIARYPDPGPWIGKNTSAHPSTARMLSIRHGVFEADGLDGVARIYGCAPLAGDGLYATVGLPRAAVLREANGILTRALMGLAAVAVIALLLAWLIGRRLVVHPVKEAVEGTLRVLRRLSSEAARRRRILQAMVDETQDAVVVVDSSGRFLHWNSALLRSHGYMAGELPFLRVWDLLPDIPPHAWPEAWNVVREAGTRHLQCSVRRRDGTIFPSDVRVTHIAIGAAEYQCALIRDVSELIAAQRALIEREARLRAILEHASNLFYSHTPDHVLTYVSPQSRMYLDCEPEEALRRWTEFVTENAINQAGYEATQRAIETGMRQPPYELELRTLKGRTLWVNVDETPVVENGRTVAIVGALTDVTAGKAAETERTRLENQLRHAQKMEAVGRLAGGVAHDFNNLLTAIMGYTQLLTTRGRPDHSMLRDAEEILKAAERAAILTRQLLTFSRKEVVEPRVLDLNALITDLGKMLRRLVGERTEMAVAATADRPTVKADPGHLQQVVVNLVVNARDAMPHGGRITIETSTVDIGEGDTGGSLDLRPGAYVLLAVSDTGTGMDEATQAQIFEPFFTTKEAGKGTGLGLATVYGIVQQCRGAIHVYSDVGWGTSFKIYLPCAEGPVEAGPSAGTLEDAPHGGETILIVEDQDAVATVMRAALETHGYRVLEARHGPDAIRTCEDSEEPIHLLVSDVVLPIMNGPELVQRIRATRPETRVLFVSGYTERSISHLGTPGGLATGFLQKPFLPGALVRKVREMLDAVSSPAA